MAPSRTSPRHEQNKTKTTMGNKNSNTKLSDNKAKMKLVVISDTHDKLIDSLPEGDVLIHCGDYSLYGEYEETKKFFDWFSSQPHKHKIVICGNHELAICPRKEGENLLKIMELIDSYSDVTFLADEAIVIDGVKFYGTPWCGGERHIMYRWGWYIESDEERAEIFKSIPDDTDVLISHSPPYDILDKYDGRTLGCPALLERIKQVKPIINVFGHIHSANGYLEQDGVHFFNCSNLSEGYQIEYPCRIIEIEDGVVKSTSTVPVKELKEPPYVTFHGEKYPPIPEKIELPPSVFKPNHDDNKTDDCIYCHVKINEKNEAMTTMRGTMCKRCFWQVFD